MSRRKKYEPKPFEHDPSSGSPPISASIFGSMLQSAAWKALTPKQHDLYLLCKYQLYGQGKQDKRDFPEVYRQDNTCFTMNRTKWADLYGLYKRNNAEGFYRDMSALIEKGFVDCVVNGKATRTKSLYRLSTRWRLYGTDNYTVPANLKTSYRYGT